MATKDKLKRFLDIANKVQNGLEVSSADLEFYMGYAPEVNEAAIDEYVAAGRGATKEQIQSALIETGRRFQSDPIFKEKILKLATDQQGSKTSEKVLEGINLVLAGTDIAASINQIRTADQLSKKSRRPSRPVVPQRDQLLAQALSESGNFSSERAIAPVKAAINDQYLNDVQDAKIASSGQSGAYGAYRQLAANRKNRASLDLAPIADNIEARNQQRYDSLLGMRLGETQNMFENQASLYPYDLRQYSQDQEAAGMLGSQGRENLRNSTYNIGGQIANSVGNYQSRRNYNRLRNQMSQYGEDIADMAVKGEAGIRKYHSPEPTTYYQDPQQVFDDYNKYNNFY